MVNWTSFFVHLRNTFKSVPDMPSELEVKVEEAAQEIRSELMGSGDKEDVVKYERIVREILHRYFK